MDYIPLGTLGIALAVLLVTSGFFSIAETAMMAVNRYRLRHRAHRGERGAKLALALLGKTDTLLGVILLGNNLINAGAATLTAVITERLLRRGRARARAGHAGDHVRYPRVLGDHAQGRRRGARRPHRAGGELRAQRRCSRVATPVVWFVNLFVQRPAPAAADQAGERSRVDAHAGGAALARAGGPVLPGQASRRCSPTCSTSRR